jgi:large subunit ribosomal protein L3
MPKAHAPRRGSMQFWPRKRARHGLVRVRSWPEQSQTKPLAFIGYKAGMTHLFSVDNRPKALTKDQDIFSSTTIIECPPMVVVGVSFYKYSKKIAQILSPKINKDLARKIPLPKSQKSKMLGSQASGTTKVVSEGLEISKKSQSKEVKKLEDIENQRFSGSLRDSKKSQREIKDFDDLRLLVHTQPKRTTIGTKKPKLLEIALGGSKEDKLKYAQEKLGQEIKVDEVFESGNSADVHGVTKGKGFQGTVKRFGVMIRSHKAEKTKRGIGNLGAWTPKRVDFRVPQPGKMGYHLRTEYNKKILKISDKPEEINPKCGINQYGLVKNTYLLIKGSVPGPKRRALVLVHSIRPNKKMIKEAAEIRYVAK